MITDREIATHLLNNCYRRMDFSQIELCNFIKQEGDLLPSDVQLFTRMKTDFASDLASAESFTPCRETADDEGGSLL